MLTLCTNVYLYIFCVVQYGSGLLINDLKYNILKKKQKTKTKQK